ncbi:L,D-transpeptidase family protein [Anaerobacillus sp. MEB173]|uniref:L,D-transpeptidase family protein n=1 Tax=Anaerobacillus sp. MEB173 TaxID=3383345 RepID=UPI003F8DAC83
MSKICGGIYVGYALEQSTKEIHHHSRRKSDKWFKNWKFSTTSIIISLMFGAISYYQATHFNTNITINGINVSGLTVDQALKELQSSVLKNEVYIGNELIFDGKDTKMGIIDDDLTEIKNLLKSQWTFFPSSKERDYILTPSLHDQYRNETLKNELEHKLISINANLEAPIDAKAVLEAGEIIIFEAVTGEQYDIAFLLNEFENHAYTSEIHLNPIYLAPIMEDSEIVKNEEKRLQELLQHSIDYNVQDQVYSLTGIDLIKNATVSRDLEVTIDLSRIKNKIAEINDTQSTLGKDFTFKTHSGSVISVKGQGYGWALDVDKEAALIQEAFQKGETTVSASNIYGNGWSGEGYGYDTLTNNGIGDTYAEVSIAEQRMWIYKDGELVVSTNVVTGKQSTNQDTLPGVWYILYKRTQYTLTGSSAGTNYAIKVDYWAPFTNSGQGFHDASWRTNWGSDAYRTAGSAGCVNVPPSIMNEVYENLSVYDPVIIY